MTAGISQIQMLYNPEEDRILFRVNSTDNKEFRFWLTRRFSIMLLKLLKDHLESDPDVSLQGTPEAKQAVQQFKRERAMSSANFREQFRGDNNDLPLGAEAKVAFKLTYSIKDENLNLGIQPKQGQGVNIVINRDINLSLTRLLLEAARKGDWKLDEWMAGASAANGEKKVIN